LAADVLKDVFGVGTAAYPAPDEIEESFSLGLDRTLYHGSRIRVLLVFSRHGIHLSS
jgi:hypothetical protein